MNIENYNNRIMAAADKISSVFNQPIDWLLILGSGLGALADKVDNPVVLPYEDIPGFPQSTVPGHAGKFVFGKWGKHTVAIMQGRFHYYEGHNIEDVVLPIRVMQSIGVKNLLLTNAAGGMGDGMKPGDLMLISDHIGFWAESPLRGPNLENFGLRFIDQSQVYNKDFGDIIIKAAKALGIKIHQGVYAYCKGPQFETPAEIRMLKMLGASAAGMSTVPEAIAATHGGMKVAAISCITNFAAGLSDQPLSHDEVMETGARVADSTIRLLTAFLSEV